MKMYVLLVIMSVALGCNKQEANNCIDIQYNKNFVAEVGKQYCLDQDNYIFIKEVQNSLCPCDVECFWEGEYILKMSVLANGKLFDYDFGTSNSTPDLPLFDNFKINFVSITPNSCDSNVQKDYRVTLVLKKE
ncbi:MAG: hypothetical protein IPO92_10900 [Saprospiraceae bacterium]|nr:hypothetical protein [Saprospiraceae bacterium]